MRMVLIALALVGMGWLGTAQATDYYTTKSGSNSNTCPQAQAIAQAKLTIAAGIACLSAGDTLFVGDGTYTEAMLNTIPAGTSTTARTTVQAINRRQAILRPGTGTRVLYIQSGRGYIKVSGFDLDATGLANDVIKVEGLSPGVWIHDNEMHNALTGHGILVQGLLVGAPTFGILSHNDIHQNGSDEFKHGLYLNTGANDWTIEHNDFYQNGKFGAQLYKEPKRAIVRYNKFRDNCRADATGGQLVVSHQGHLIEHNFFYKNAGQCTSGLSVYSHNPLNNIIRHNSFHCATGTCTTGISINSVSVNTTVQNNLVIGYTTAVNHNASVGTVETGTLSTGSAASHYTSTATGNLSLVAGSTAIDTAPDLGFAYCGTAPDRGATETLKVVSASITGNLMDVTVCTTQPPLQPLGTWTPACTGAGCGTPANSGVSLLGGSGGIARITTGGITGGYCAAGQTWTVTASGATNTDSALIGNAVNQPLHTTTNFPVDSSACDGTGSGGAPTLEEAHYQFENNLTDSSGNGNTATGSNISYTTALDGQGVLTVDGADSYIDSGLLTGHNPSTTHLVVATWIYIDPANLGQTKDVWGVPTGTDQRFLFYRHSGNTWRMSIGATSGTASEFPVVAGWTHGCIKMHPTGDIATMYINGQAGTISGASVISNYGSYVFAGDLRFGLPSGFPTTLSGAHLFEDAFIYTSDVSCQDLYAAGQPPTTTAVATQATHKHQGVFTSGGVAEDRGAADAQRTVVKGGAAAVMVQLNNTSGASTVIQPRFRYNINGGEFSNVVPETATADGISYWGGSRPTGLNEGIADGPISGALAHTDGVTLTTTSATPTITIPNNGSYTLRGIFNVDATVGDVVCFKVYDQGGSALVSYTPAAGACVTVIATQSNGAP